MEKIIKQEYQYNFMYINVEKFKSFDGEVFDSEEYCLKHEEKLNKKEDLKNKYSVSKFNFDFFSIDSKDNNLLYTIEIKKPLKCQQLIDDLIIINDVISLEKFHLNDLIINKSTSLKEGIYIVSPYNVKNKWHYMNDNYIFLYSKEYLLEKTIQLKDKIEKL